MRFGLVRLAEDCSSMTLLLHKTLSFAGEDEGTPLAPAKGKEGLTGILSGIELGAGPRASHGVAYGGSFFPCDTKSHAK